MLESVKGSNFTYTRLTPEEIKERGILGTLYGPIADTKKPTRNGRLYPREAWEKAINDEIFQEQLRSKAILGELEHPEDRDTIDPREACMCLASTPKIGDDGLLYGEFHILDLPNGRILKALCDYGTVIGVSSRGQGDVTEDFNGERSIDPSSFDLTCWDAVILPAVKKARMNYIKESLGNKSLTESLREISNNAKDGEKKIIDETLARVKDKLVEDITTQKSENIKETVSKGVETKKTGVENNVPNKLVQDLKESIKSKVLLESKVQKLQEQLAVSDTKATQLEDELAHYKEATIRLSKLVNENKNLNKTKEQLEETIKQQEKQIKLQSNQIKNLVESAKKKETREQSLNETLSNKDNRIVKLREQLEESKKSFEESKVAFNTKLNELNDKNEGLQIEIKSLKEDYSKKITKATKVVEKYKGYVTTTVEKYINSKAVMLGVTPNEIKNRLNESYTLDDIDKVCEELQGYNLRVSRLPFNIEKGTQISVRESKQPFAPKQQVKAEDDCTELETLVNIL